MEIRKAVELDCINGTIFKPPGSGASLSAFSLVSLVYQLLASDSIFANLTDYRR